MTSPALYSQVADDCAAIVITRYSSSFGLASRLLSKPIRGHVANIYALVRVVDNRDVALEVDVRGRLLEQLRDDLRVGIATGYSHNLIVHAFATSARFCGIGPELIDPFFRSMEMDLRRRTHTQQSFDEYVHGSAEVIGLMCLRVFLAVDPSTTRSYEDLAPGARALGAAFQKINFLRDLGDDHDVLNRAYFPGLDPDAFTDRQRDAILSDIDVDLSVADGAIQNLPRSSRHAVRAAQLTFAELSARLRATPAEQIRTKRVRVPNAVKLRIVGRSLRSGGTA